MAHILLMFLNSPTRLQLSIWTRSLGRIDLFQNAGSGKHSGKATFHLHVQHLSLTDG
jgi:hypothetical protein